MSRIEVGTTFGDFILAQIDHNTAMFINTKNGQAYDGIHYLISSHTLELTDVNDEDIPRCFNSCDGCDCNETPNGALGQAQPDSVKFYRYLRLYDRYDVFHQNPDPYVGVTFAFEIDYKLNEISLGYSICNGALFRKDIGRTLADCRLQEDPIIICFSDEQRNFENITVLDFCLKYINSTGNKHKLHSLIWDLSYYY